MSDSTRPMSDRSAPQGDRGGKTPSPGTERQLADMTPEEFRSEFLYLLDMYSDGGIGCDHLADKIAALRDADRGKGWDNGYAAGCFETAASTVPCPTCGGDKFVRPDPDNLTAWPCSCTNGRITREKPPPPGGRRTGGGGMSRLNLPAIEDPEHATVDSWRRDTNYARRDERRQIAKALREWAAKMRAAGSPWDANTINNVADEIDPDVKP